MNFFLRPATNPLNIAHRGGAARAPENTLLAFRKGLLGGADALEADLRGTRDGVVVVCHDATVDRTTEGRGAVKEMTFRELRTLDAGYRFTPDGGLTHPCRGKGIRIPSLEEVFRDPVLQRAPMVLEIKQEEPSIVDDVLDLIRSHGMEDCTILGSFHRAVLEQAREGAATRGMKVLSSFGAEEVATFFQASLADATDGRYVPPALVLQVPDRYTIAGKDLQVVDAGFMAKAKALGIRVHVWTVNDPERMRLLIKEMRVDGILTDEPARLYHLVHPPCRP